MEDKPSELSCTCVWVLIHVCGCLGNLLVVPVVKMIGLTMGLTVWGVTNMLNGWFQGRYDCVCSSLETRPSFHSAGCNYDHQHTEERSGDSCTVFVCSTGICVEPMGCEMSHDRPHAHMECLISCNTWSMCMCMCTGMAWHENIIAFRVVINIPIRHVTLC